MSRAVHIDGQEWRYKVGWSHVVCRSDDKKIVLKIYEMEAADLEFQRELEELDEDSLFPLTYAVTPRKVKEALIATLRV